MKKVVDLWKKLSNRLKNSIQYDCVEELYYYIMTSYDIKLCQSNILNLINVFSAESFAFVIDGLDINGSSIKYIKNMNLEYKVIDTYDNRINIIVIVSRLIIEGVIFYLVNDQFNSAKIDGIIYNSRYKLDFVSFQRLTKENIISFSIIINNLYSLSIIFNKQSIDFKKNCKKIKQINFERKEEMLFEIPSQEKLHLCCEKILSDFNYSLMHNKITELCRFLNLELCSKICSIKSKEKTTYWFMCVDILDKQGKVVIPLDDDEMELSNSINIATVQDDGKTYLFDWNCDFEDYYMFDIYLYELEKMKKEYTRLNLQVDI